jgi:hypothetical protein
VGYITGTNVAPRERPDKAELKRALEARVVALWSNPVRARFCEDKPHLKTNRQQSGSTAFEYGLCPTPAIFVFQIAHIELLVGTTPLPAILMQYVSARARP